MAAVDRTNIRRFDPGFESLPGRHRTGQPGMQGEVAEVVGLIVGVAQRTVGDPDALSMEIPRAGRWVARRFLWTSSRKTAADAEWPLPVARRDREWRQRRRWPPYCLRLRTRCRDTDESSRAPGAANEIDPPIRPAQFVGLGPKMPCKSSCNAGWVPRTSICGERS